MASHFSELLALTSPDNNFQHLRQELAIATTSGGPSIPFLGKLHLIENTFFIHKILGLVIRDFDELMQGGLVHEESGLLLFSSLHISFLLQVSGI